jgi:hypothetical protein
MRKLKGWLMLGMVCGWGLSLQATAGVEEELSELRQAVAELQQRDAIKSQRIQELQQKLNSAGTTGAHARLQDEVLTGESPDEHDGHGHIHRPDTGHAWNIPVSETTRVGINWFASAGVVFGGSTANEEHLERLASGEHDANNDGIDFTGLELELSGDVGEYFSFNAGMVFLLEAESLETEVELEEAYATSKNWPAGLEMRVGYFYTEFGLDNPVHSHDRIWLDQSILRSRIFGGDGLRSTGARLAWELPVAEWDSEFIFGFQSARGGGTVASFGGGELGHHHGHGDEEHFYEEGIAGRPIEEFKLQGLNDFLWSARWQNRADITDDLSAQLGFSGAFGRNFTGGDGFTVISGADFEMLWKPAGKEDAGQQLLWQTELAIRHLHADVQNVTLPNGTRVRLGAEDYQDLGLYSQLLYSFNKNWHAGVRYDFANRLAGDTIEIDEGTGAIQVENEADAFRSERHRVSPLVIYQPTENARFRLQYNYDTADFLQQDAHSFWFGMQFAIGECHADHSH